MEELVLGILGIFFSHTIFMILKKDDRIYRKELFSIVGLLQGFLPA